EAGAVPPALEKRDTRKVLKRLDLFRQRGLRHAQLFSSSMISTGLSQRDEGSKQFNIHSIRLSK
ncbi:hypothetical protein VH86_21575, partial [Pantoea sp. BL1]